MISVDELALLFEAVGGNCDDAPSCFDALDDIVNKDGYLSRDEFMAHFMECAQKGLMKTPKATMYLDCLFNAYA